MATAPQRRAARVALPSHMLGSSEGSAGREIQDVGSISKQCFDHEQTFLCSHERFVHTVLSTG